MLSEIAAAWAVRLGYVNVIRYPAGYIAWVEHFPEQLTSADRSHRLQPGEFFPPCLLTASDRRRDFAYLGIDQEPADFFLADVRAELVLLTYYGEYCSQCVKDLPLYARLFDMIENDPDLDVKMIGIGVGNDQRSVLRFQRAHNVPYPLLADERRIIFDSVGGGEVPLLYLVRIMPDARVKAVFFHEGHLEDFEELLARIRKEAGGG